MYMFSIKLSYYENNFPMVGQGNFKVGNIDVNLCTHLVYAFAVLNTQSFTLKIFDDWLDKSLKNYEKFVDLKKSNPNLKTLIAIGGWTDSQKNAASYKKMFKSKSLMQKFARYKIYTVTENTFAQKCSNIKGMRLNSWTNGDLMDWTLTTSTPMLLRKLDLVTGLRS